jgi:hypothetical protein
MRNSNNGISILFEKAKKNPFVTFQRQSDEEKLWIENVGKVWLLLQIKIPSCENFQAKTDLQMRPWQTFWVFCVCVSVYEIYVAEHFMDVVFVHAIKLFSLSRSFEFKVFI